MGYRPPRKIYDLDFTGTEYEGLAVKMRGLTVGEELQLDELRTGDGAERRGFELMTSLLVAWNIEDDQGQPVPPTFEGVCSQDSVMIGAVIDALKAAVSGVPDPLPQSSPDGGPSPEASIPMEPLSPSPVPSAVPA